MVGTVGTVTANLVERLFIKEMSRLWGGLLVD